MSDWCACVAIFGSVAVLLRRRTFGLTFEIKAVCLMRTQRKKKLQRIDVPLATKWSREVRGWTASTEIHA